MNKMKVLIACEFSGIVRDAFIAKGHDAWSCDILPTERPGPHIQGDVLDVMEHGWELMIAHPPCTYLAVSGARYWKDRIPQQKEALRFVKALMNAPVGKIAIENPVGKISTSIRKPDQYIQPYEHGHKISKKTGLWLKNLPLLKPSEVVEPEWIYYKNGGRCSPDHYKNAFAKNRSHLRSVTFQGIADAMADQWG